MCISTRCDTLEYFIVILKLWILPQCRSICYCFCFDCFFSIGISAMHCSVTILQAFFDDRIIQFLFFFFFSLCYIKWSRARAPGFSRVSLIKKIVFEIKMSARAHSFVRVLMKIYSAARYFSIQSAFSLYVALCRGLRASNGAKVFVCVQLECASVDFFFLFY